MDFIKMIEQERTRLHTEMEKLETEKQGIDTKIDGIRTELRAIDAYENAKTGKKLAKGKRSTGLSQQILDALKSKSLSRAQLIEALGAKGNKRMEGSLSNALTNLKKAKKLTAADGQYSLHE